MDADGFEIVESRFQYGEQPGLKVDKAANLKIYLSLKGEPFRELNITLVDVRGQLKLVQVN